MIDKKTIVLIIALCFMIISIFGILIPYGLGISIQGNIETHEYLCFAGMIIAIGLVIGSLFMEYEQDE